MGTRWRLLAIVCSTLYSQSVMRLIISTKPLTSWT
nr:MAG TPA: Prion-like protein doppel helix DHPC NMR [Caudoviricetes sp.]